VAGEYQADGGIGTTTIQIFKNCGLVNKSANYKSYELQAKEFL
jgi:hypothetical protein